MEPNQIVQPAVDAASFTVKGVVYTRTNTLTVARHRILQRIQTELAFDVSLRSIMQQVNLAWKHLEEGKIGSGIHALGNLKESLGILGTGRSREAEVCALFYNAPGEDPAHYDYEAMQLKIEAWGAVDRDFFMGAAYTLLLLTSTVYPLPGAEPPALAQ